MTGRPDEAEAPRAASSGSPGDQKAAMRNLADAVVAELERREAGETPDRRFDPLLAFLADATEEIVAWHKRATSE